MCGIAGIFHYGDMRRPVDTRLLQRMLDTIAHRGPDDQGVWASGPVALGNRRLAIVDLHASGHQPMATADARGVLTYNGEFYNHRGFRDRLAAKGYRFRGTSDTETMLCLLDAWGPNALSEVAGIFGLAWYDARAQRLVLARDPLGVKQVYTYDSGDSLYFASEMKALLHVPQLSREVDPQAVNEYLHFHTPLFERTFFRHVRQLRPGEYLEISSQSMHRRVYWKTDGFEPRDDSPADNIEQLKALFATVIKDQLMSDVPVGAFFSGGIDSSTVAAFAKRSGRRLRCFGVHFSNQGVIDERPYQEAAARALGLDLELTTVDGASFPDDLLALSYAQDQPVIGAAMIPMYYVSRLASGYVKVCLGGQAADEIFGGYARYAVVHPGRTLRALVFRRRPVAASPDHEAVGGNLRSQLCDAGNLQRAIRRVNPFEAWSTRYFRTFVKVPERTWQAVLDPSFVSRGRAREQFEDGVARSPAVDPADKVLHWDLQTYLPGLFQQDDRMSMANSLESRVPLADPRLVRFALHTSFDLKMRDGASKWILRQAVADVLPAEVLNRRKVGFDTPAEQWMRGPHQSFVRDLLLSSAARARGLSNPAGVRALLDQPETPNWYDVIWKLAAIEAWATTCVDSLPAFHTPPVPVLEPARL
jgi:asparagine synthase (glutamine-hydrolysing)